MYSSHEEGMKKERGVMARGITGFVSVCHGPRRHEGVRV